MEQFLENIRTHFNIIHKEDYLSLTLINPNLDLDIIKEVKDKFRLMHHIKRQQIVIIESVTFDDQLLQTLADALPESLEELSLDFTGCQSLRGVGFAHLFERLSSMNLKKLKLDFSEVYDINDVVIQGLCLLLQSLQDLQEFYLDLYEVDQITEEGYMLLAQSFSELLKLTSLHLDFSANPNLTEDNLELFFTNIDPTSLTKFQFRILDIDHIGGGSFFKFGELLAKMQNLQTLQITISTFSHLNHKGTYSILKEVTYMEKLKELSLNFSDTSLPQKILSYLRAPPSLESLNIDVSCNKQLEDGDILSLIKNIKNLSKLTLNVDFCNRVSDDSLEEFVQIFLKNLKCTELYLPDRKYSSELLRLIIKLGMEAQFFIHFETAEINEQIKQEYENFQKYLQKKRHTVSIIKQFKDENKHPIEINEILAVMN